MTDESAVLKTGASLMAISAMAAASRFLMSKDKRTLLGFLRGFILATFVGAVAALLLQDYNFSPAMQGAIVGIAAFIADDILMFVLKIVKIVTNNPGILIDWLINFLMGLKK